MTKFKTTKKAMKEDYSKIVNIGYCNAQYLLQYQQPMAYSTRAEGWACDYYDIDGVLISTGYAPLESKRANYTYDILKEYDNAAQKIVHEYSMSYEDQKQQVNTLLAEFIAKITK